MTLLLRSTPPALLLGLALRPAPLLTVTGLSLLAVLRLTVLGLSRLAVALLALLALLLRRLPVPLMGWLSLLGLTPPTRLLRVALLALRLTPCAGLLPLLRGALALLVLALRRTPRILLRGTVGSRRAVGSPLRLPSAPSGVRR